MQPDWVDTNKIAIPQADEQQRLLVNLITTMERDKLPLPRFWYLPRGKKAVVVMSGDDHSPGRGARRHREHFDRFKALSPAGCVGRATGSASARPPTSIPDSAAHERAGRGVHRQGFEVALHPCRRLPDARLARRS